MPGSNPGMALILLAPTKKEEDMSTLRPRIREVIVAIKFDAQVDNLMKVACSLARASGMPLRLTHVCSRGFPIYLGGYLGSGGMSAQQPEAFQMEYEWLDTEPPAPQTTAVP